MNYQLHKIQEGFVVTSDEKIKQGDCVRYKTGEIIDYSVELNTDNLSKLIAQQDQLDFSALSEEEQKKIGWFDVASFASVAVICNGGLITTENEQEVAFSYYYQGFQKAQELLSDRMFTKKDMAEFGQFMIRQYVLFRNNDDNFSERMLSEYLSYKSWDIELEMEYVGSNNDGSDIYEPKITNGKFKITKIL